MDNLYEESIKAAIGRLVRKVDSEQAKGRLFNSKIGLTGKSTFTSKSLYERDFKKAKELEKTMRTENSFTKYIKAYKEFESLIGMPHATIIYKISYNKTNQVTVVYSSQEKHITVPNNDANLYHKSPAKFSELRPTFRGKQTGDGISRGGYLYDSNRVYLSLTDKLPKNMADLKANAKFHLYKIKENLNNLIVDPAFNSSILGAVYINTSYPIKVEEVKPSDIKDHILKSDVLNTITKKKAKETKERIEDFYNKGYISESDRNLYISAIDYYDI